MEGQSLLDSGESSASKYNSRVGRARLANQNARKQVQPPPRFPLPVPPPPPAPTPPPTPTPPPSSPPSPSLLPRFSRPMPQPPSRLRHPSHSSAAPLVTASVRTTVAAGRHPPTYPDTHPFSHPPSLRCVQKMGVIAFGSHDFAAEQQGQRSPIGSAPARLLRPWRLRAARRSQEEQSAKKKPPMSSDRLWPCRWSCPGAAAIAKLAKRAAPRTRLRRQRPQPYLDATARSARSARRRRCRSRARLCSEPLQPRCSPSCPPPPRAACCGIGTIRPSCSP